MILYHGSNAIVSKPQIIISDRRLDFGAGFYLTSDGKQAERWAILTAQRRNTESKIVSIFEVQESLFSTLNTLHFSSANVEWLKFVSSNRNKLLYSGESYDIIIGPVANDRTMPVLKQYFAGIYTEEEALKRLLPQKLKDQYAFKTEYAISLLQFKGVEYL